MLASEAEVCGGNAPLPPSFYAYVLFNNLDHVWGGLQLSYHMTSGVPAHEPRFALSQNELKNVSL